MFDYQGNPGLPGPQGLKGERGEPGMEGLRGVKGISGLMGKDGRKGFIGRPGLQGNLFKINYLLVSSKGLTGDECFVKFVTITWFDYRSLLCV